MVDRDPIELIAKLRARASEHRAFAGVPCQCDASWHADEIDGWADELESLLGSARLQKEDVEHLVRWLERERAGVDHHHYCSWRQVVEKTLDNLSALITPSVGESMESYKENKDGER